MYVKYEAKLSQWKSQIDELSIFHTYFRWYSQYEEFARFNNTSFRESWFTFVVVVMATLAGHRVMDYWYHSSVEGVAFRPQICRILHRMPLVNNTTMVVESFFIVGCRLEHFHFQTSFSFFNVYRVKNFSCSFNSPLAPIKIADKCSLNCGQ